ncbi:hypothetical protein K490DRAFT_36956 [Saccharata proteae CBS 121410]|uniref:Uncharacterized protein n=1 Tax=Saccharata proteae CBS 121410 TaxID=1314787 RepID=A0A6A5YDQ9_9PEZI|nr:hypothetical protein K490DRAFT_36956 [Saccharata proteae CBS 121410]
MSNSKPYRSLGLPYISKPFVFAAGTGLLLALQNWPWRWVLSGAPLLTYSLLLGASKGTRIFPAIPLWTILTTLNLLYAVAATSWLLYWFFAAGCYTVLPFSCLFQFDAVANFARKRLRTVLKELHFMNDKIAFFDLPALEIDTEVDGLMVIRGLTISLSTLTIVAHGVEVGVKLSDDMEIALQTEIVTIPLFRRIDVGDVYGNLKGGQFEMTFGTLAGKAHDDTNGQLIGLDTPLLKAAAKSAEALVEEPEEMKDEMTNGNPPQASSIEKGLESVTQLSPDDEKADRKYKERLMFIHKSSTISQSRSNVNRRDSKVNGQNQKFDHGDKQHMRAAVCAQLHDKPTIPHPPRRSIKVTTIQNLPPPWLRRFLHRLPLLLRLLLNLISYFHPVNIASITAAGSGKWIRHMLEEKVFQGYGADGGELERLQQRIFTWLADANFAVEMANITGFATVPLMTAFDIVCRLFIDDVMMYRTLPEKVDLKQVVRLGGADSTIAVPTFLLPHHEHLLPSVPTRQDMDDQQHAIDNAQGAPKTIQAQYDLDQMKSDETNVKISAHVRLPACFDQTLLDFISALVKATKIVEMGKEEDALDQEVHSVKEFSKALHSSMKEKFKKTAVDAVANDRWIAKLVGKATRKLETAQGDVGYSGNIPVALAPYRAVAEDATKLLA